MLLVNISFFQLYRPETALFEHFMPSPNATCIAPNKCPPPSQRKVIIQINAQAFIRIFMVCQYNMIVSISTVQDRLK